VLDATLVWELSLRLVCTSDFGSDNFGECCDLKIFSHDNAAIYTNVLTCLNSQILDLARNARQGQTQGDIARV
jgi:hypothetical protein